MDVLTLLSIGLGIIIFGFFNGIGTATAQWYFANHLQHKISSGLDNRKKLSKKLFKFFGVE